MFLIFFKIFLNEINGQSWVWKIMATLVMGQSQYVFARKAKGEVPS